MPKSNRPWIWFGVFLCLTALILIWFPNAQTLFSHIREEGSAPTVEFTNGMIVNVEIADTQAERVLGLYGHEPLLENEGMFFVFPNKEIQGFWMKDMLFPIDIIWIDGQMVVGFQQNAQPENPVKTIYYSPAPVDSVLEVQAGFVVQNEVHIGDLLDVDFADE